MKNKKILIWIIILIIFGIIYSLIDFGFGLSGYFNHKGAYHPASLSATLLIFSLLLVGYIIGRIKKIKGLPILFAIIIVIIYFGVVISDFFIYFPHHQRECRQTDSWDKFKECYINKAKENNDPMVCAGITYWETFFVVPPGGYRGLNALFARSDCFYELSKLKNTSSYCRFVTNPDREKCYKLAFTKTLPLK